MKTEKNILIAFILNLVFSILEFTGGIFTGSVAIVSDAVHDLGDAATIGISYFMEKKSHKQPDETYTFGYGRYSVLGGLITTTVLLLGSFTIIINAVGRIASPNKINYDGMLVLSVIGVCVNLVAALVTHKGFSLNQKSVNLHMLEDTLGWIVVLIGAVVMKFTGFVIIDPVMSIAIAVFIVINAIKNLKAIFDILLEKSPDRIDLKEIKEHLCKIEGVIDVHHIHIWSADGRNNYATMHIVTKTDFCHTKEKIRRELQEFGIVHATLELETPNENCTEKHCSIQIEKVTCCHHH